MTDRTENRLLHLLKNRGPQTAAEAGAALGLSTPGAQQQLARLAATELIEPEDRRHGRGRPRRYWRLTGKGHARFPDRHSDLTVEMLEATRAVFGAEGLERLIAHREAETLAAYRATLAKTGDLPDRVAAFAAIRSREGYMAECRAEADGSWLLVENHCPICAAAAVCQGLCRAELSIFRAALGPEAQVERVEHLLAGARRCAYRVTRAAP